MNREQALQQIPEIPARNKLRCYNTAGHKRGDQTPSIHLYDNGYYCYSCGEHGTYDWLVKQFNGFTPTSRSYPMEEKKEYKQYDLTALWKKLPQLPEEAFEIMFNKGFTPEQLSNWRWHTFEVEGWKPGIFMPYIANGTIVAARLRCLEGVPRFMSLPGGESWPYCFNTLRSKPYVFVTEGETDCLTLNVQRIPAVGIPGATNSNAINKMVAEAQAHGTTLVVVPDNDDAGAKFKERVFVACFKASVPCYEFTVPAPHKDLNDWYVMQGAGDGGEMLEVMIGWLMEAVDEFRDKVSARAAVTGASGPDQLTIA